ncbi:hypothetical protein BC829DRAFT_91575 [Chytridium lagenaria]|nr:hypothetical protein BC829DRAFT_91575 [Chytridium lagenaria]
MDQIISKASSASASASSMASSLSSSLASAASSSSSSSQNLYSKRHLITSPTILLPVILKRLRRRHPFLLLSLSITIPFLSISLLILSLIFPSSSSSSSSSPSAKPPPSSSFLTFLSTLLRRSLRLTSSSSSYTDLHEEVILRIDADPDRRMAHISNLRRLNNAAVDAASTSSPSSPASPVLTPRFFSMNGAPRGSSGSLTSVGSTSLLSGKARSARSIVLTISIQNVSTYKYSREGKDARFLL